jgi:hypothetical protein
MTKDDWALAMTELNGALEEAKDSGVTKAEAIQEVENVYEKE